MLPKLDVPVFETKLVSNGKSVKYRPFLVKEQKLFLMASQSEEVNEIINVVKQVLNNCILTKEIDIDSLPIFDIEHLFLQLRSKSVGEIVELNYTCNNNIEVDGQSKKCGNLVSLNVDLSKVEADIDPTHTAKIQLTENMGIMMKYPTFNMVEKYNTDNVNIFDMIIECIDFIYDKDSIYYSKDVEKSEMVEFIENLQQVDFAKVEQFFSSMPKMKQELDFKCPKCHYEEKILVEGIQNFFG